MKPKPNHTETFMQQMFALGTAVNYLLRTYPDSYREKKPTANCIGIITRSGRLANAFRGLPKWKKWILNWVLNPEILL